MSGRFHLAGLALLLVSQLVAGADQDSVKAPYVETGDCWSYRAANMFYQGKPVRDYELCVTLVESRKGRILGLARVKDDDREIDTTYSLEWSPYASISGVVTPEGIRYFKFPLRVGDAWSTEYSFKAPRIGTNTGTARYEMKVVGWEDITVSAGAFRVLRIEGRGTRYLDASQSNLPQSITLWYSQKVGRYVKLVYISGALSLSEELTGFRLNQ